MPAYINPPREPDTLTGSWQPTGRTRLRSSWFGLLIVEVEQSAMVMVAAPRNGSALGTWKHATRWRRARRGHLVTLGSDAFAALRRSKPERH
jgi:hypothetical protein